MRRTPLAADAAALGRLITQDHGLAEVSYIDAAYAVAVNAGMVWRLYHQGELVGEIDEQSHDFPWTYGRFRPLPGFEPLRPLFVAWNVAVDAEDDEAMERAYEAVRAAVTLTHPDGHQVAEFLLSIEDDEVGFRWHDEPVGSG
ncbi:hypothetical protein [Micromonospora sp. NPDC023956]|uniref:hypothetical protein n=1 Tax=Micromonospora sp. NPDC023956 TaxID=3155722 RepID=UPI0033CED868